MEDRFLFKAKRIDNGDWVQGSCVYTFAPSKGYVVGIMVESYFIVEENGNIISIDKNTICQCTGLKDKSGKLIWENDIVDRKETYSEIVKYKDGDWISDYSHAHNKEAGSDYCNLGFYVQERKCVEVIGNIFDNPELLESEG